ncbi:hypothetical protein ACA910_001822 [Epithemia clementina (nom. ined.)]
MDVEPYVVGLCPYFWSHVPLSIQQVHSMRLIHGLHCLVSLEGEEQDHHQPDHNNNHNDNNDQAQAPRARQAGGKNQDSDSYYCYRVQPLSKCHLLGTIVAMDRRGNNTLVVVLDDGTGLVDCVYWSNNCSSSNHHSVQEQGGGGDAFCLPLLLDDVPGASSPTDHLCVGQLVQVFGQIDCACVLFMPDNGPNDRDNHHGSRRKKRKMANSSPSSDGAAAEEEEERETSFPTTSGQGGQNARTSSGFWSLSDVQWCKHEIRASWIQPIFYQNDHHHHNTKNSMNAGSYNVNVEIEHWKRVQEFDHQFRRLCSRRLCSHHHHHQSFPACWWDGGATGRHGYDQQGSTNPTTRDQISGTAVGPHLLLLNVRQIMQLLGPQIRDQIGDLTHFPSAAALQQQDPHNHKNNNSYSVSLDWQLFGPRCQCRDDNDDDDDDFLVPHKYRLLYCHCMATRLVVPKTSNSVTSCGVKDKQGDHDDDEDPNFVYRDALLSKLLQMEDKEQQKKQQQATEASNRSSGANVQSKRAMEEPWRFQYSTIIQDPTLVQLAQRLLGRHQEQPRHNKKDSTNKRWLLSSSSLALNTFRALRADGIVYLLDPESDTYLLLSRQRAIEPYLRRSMGLAPVSSVTDGNHAGKDAVVNDHLGQKKTTKKPQKPPIYWSSIPKARIQYVKRQLLWEQQQRRQEQEDFQRQEA